MIDINLLSFENNLADFELYNGDEILTCHASIHESNIVDFFNGELDINPHAWYNLNDESIDKPEWFKRKELNLLSEAFEDGYKKICEKMVDDQGGLM